MKTMQFNFTNNTFHSAKIQFSHRYKTTTDQSHSQMKTMVALLERPRLYQGFFNGYRQPVARILLKVTSFNPAQMQVLKLLLNEYFGIDAAQFNQIQSEYDLIACLGEGVRVIQQAAGFPVFDSVQVERNPDQNNMFTLWIPYLHEECFHHVMAFMLQFIAQHLAGNEAGYNHEIANEISALIDSLKQDAPKGVNGLRMLETAYYDSIPWCYLAQNIFQYGYGRYSRWLDSTFTDATSHLAAGLARDKRSVISFLKASGLPVPEQYIVRNELEAVDSAVKIGFPVVIKPHNQDGGKGVHARLMSVQQVKKAYENARQYSETVLLEKHIIGKDYRLLILNGKLVWAIERVPAGVTGNGVNTIYELIQQVNQTRVSIDNKPATLKQINISDDTHEFLADQGHHINSIPLAGQFIAVSRIANISAGGMPIAVMDQIHPDNQRLAETAARLLRLDIAGIDCILPDIKASYLTTGGACIEVNAQPQLGTITAGHMYQHILTTLLPQQGRIPIIVICSHASEDSLIQKLCSLLSNEYKSIGIAKDRCAYLNGAQLNHAASLYDAAQLLLRHNLLDALIYCIRSMEDLENHGLPFDRYSCLFFMEVPDSQCQKTKQLERDFIHTIMQSCYGQRFLNQDTTDYLSRHGHSNQSGMVLTRSSILHEIEIGLNQWLHQSDDTELTGTATV